MSDNEDELLSVLDKDGNKTGKIETRNYVHENMLFHDIVRVFVINKEDILLEKRSIYKKTNPGKLCTPGGHVLYNESVLDAAIKEVYEEIGLKINAKDIKFISRIKQIKNDHRSFKNSYYIYTDKKIEEFKIQKSEVEKVLYMNFFQFLKMIKSNNNKTTYDYYEEKELFDKLEKIVKR